MSLILSGLGIVTILACSKGLEFVLVTYHSYKPKMKKKGDKHEITHSELLREESKKLR